MKNVHFIDCGANIGKAIDWAKNEYKEELIKVDAFEPEYFNYTELKDKFFKENDIDVTVHTQAVWVKNVIKNFYVQGWGARTGSSLIFGKEHVVHKGQVINQYYKGRREYGVDPKWCEIGPDGLMRAKMDLSMIRLVEETHNKAQCIDFSSWVIKNTSKENFNVLKIDIEGAEYEVIEHLLETGAYKLIDKWLVEFTPRVKVPNYRQKVINNFEEKVGDYVDWGAFG